MKATELMAGNYLSYNGQIIKVENITNKKVGYHIKDNECRMHYARLHECKPIPLEKVHLTKNGFKAREETYGIEFYYYDRYVIKVDFYKGYKLTDCDKNSWWEDFKAYTSCIIEQKPAEN